VLRYNYGKQWEWGKVESEDQKLEQIKKKQKIKKAKNKKNKKRKKQKKNKSKMKKNEKYDLTVLSEGDNLSIVLNNKVVLIDRVDNINRDH
jgi:hypothetical protein